MNLTLGFLLASCQPVYSITPIYITDFQMLGSLSFPLLSAHSETAWKVGQAAGVVLATKIDFKMYQEGVMGVEQKHLPFPTCSPKETNSHASTLFHPTKHAQDLGNSIYNSCKTVYSGACYPCYSSMGQ